MSEARRIPVIGLAGGIGAGKSAVASVLARAGCVISDSDRDAAIVLADPAVVDPTTVSPPRFIQFVLS